VELEGVSGIQQRENRLNNKEHFQIANFKKLRGAVHNNYA